MSGHPRLPTARLHPSRSLDHLRAPSPVLKRAKPIFEGMKPGNGAKEFLRHAQDGRQSGADFAHGRRGIGLGRRVLVSGTERTRY